MSKLICIILQDLDRMTHKRKVMLSNKLITFCNRWLEKADKYTNDTTEDVFDKFFSLYVVYNAIYTEATIKLKENNPKISNGDRISAVKNISTYIGHDILSKSLLDMSNDINKVIELIKKGTFYISTKRDEKGNIVSSNDEDDKLINIIETYISTQKRKDWKKFNEAVLSLIYGVRCNMFHGDKSFDPIQKQLLIPVNKILEMIIKELLLQNNGKGE